ncbi:hypothetical protein [Kitasatospora viridis]|uniref:Uncharacterized protein n=1 Tax=Kitasatospora viridis TaxID=281105 RepID=A0A561TTY8_9ACTN|nr:hypothetical protein [Kitasatospora viridis]TWF90582.1 hypothetical protein FHX73_13630 [Kitasatospora viridis]
MTRSINSARRYATLAATAAAAIAVGTVIGLPGSAFAGGTGASARPVANRAADVVTGLLGDNDSLHEAPQAVCADWTGSASTSVAPATPDMC